MGPAPSGMVVAGRHEAGITRKAAAACQWGLLNTRFGPHRASCSPLPLRSSNKLTGTLPAQFGNAWPLMEDLQLARNNFLGSFPVAWFAMKRMRILKLQ